MNAIGWSDPKAMEVESPESVVSEEVIWQGKLLPSASKGPLVAAGDVTRAGVASSMWPLAIVAKLQAAATILEKAIAFRPLRREILVPDE